jgi:sterol desaturase/sphingolipid hydroxylase (fatty acid hydroxylase superfamily)
LGALAPFLEHSTIGALQWAFGDSPAIAPTTAWKVLYGLITILVVDACFFFYHLLMHRTRIGWAIHKVHHSAAVLTPLTRQREHFLEAPIDAAFSTVGLAISGGVFAYVFNGGITHITIIGVGIFFFLYTLNGNFRHYHVSFRYPRWLEYWLQSPGMHHTHHSILEKHWDSNLGLVTSIWDRMFGTLYIAERDEETPWGLAPQEQANYETLSQNLLTPFREIGSILFNIPSRSAADAHAPTNRPG